MNLYQQTYHCLMLNNVSKKQNCVEALFLNWENNKLKREDCELLQIETPGRPDKPELIDPTKLKRRKLGSTLGRAMLIHAILHIEFNAINLALDAVYRFRNMPTEYYSHWLKIAVEESSHFTLLKDRLHDLGYAYGDFPAHNGLWEMVLKTQHDVLIRMALVPRVLEARGLDVTPAMMQRLEVAGDNKTVDILKIILREEIGHVAIGSHWFKYCCKQQNKEPEKTFRDLLMEYMGTGLKEPLHTEARLQAGFTQKEIDELVHLTQGSDK